jgi:hypothetical protein
MRWAFCFLTLLTLASCASVTYTEKHQINTSIDSLTVVNYKLTNTNKTHTSTQKIRLTKNGRIAYAQHFDTNDSLIKTLEKKLWFTKQSFPNKEPYYCKTRWKPGKRERISCYTQKQYKQNEVIYHYNKNGSIHKIVDNFITYDTEYYHYDVDGLLTKIIIEDKNGNSVESINISCESKDSKDNCINLKKTYTKAGETIQTTTVFYYKNSY